MSNKIHLEDAIIFSKEIILMKSRFKAYKPELIYLKFL